MREEQSETVDTLQLESCGTLESRRFWTPDVEHEHETLILVKATDGDMRRNERDGICNRPSTWVRNISASGERTPVSRFRWSKHIYYYVIYVSLILVYSSIIFIHIYNDCRTALDLDILERVGDPVSMTKLEQGKSKKILCTKDMFIEYILNNVVYRWRVSGSTVSDSQGSKTTRLRPKQR
jgi:hypothetical protein